MKDLLPQMSDTLKSFEALNVRGGQIDKANGVIKGACAIRIGQAKGHDTWVDSKTLETAKAVVSKFSEGVKVKFRHSTAGQFTSVIEETFGLIKDFVIDGDKLRGDLYLLESLPADIKAKAFEMAEKMANQFGLSIVFRGKNENIEGKNFLRCEAITSIDLTENPAANDGLFSMKTIKYESGESGKHAKDCMCGECDDKSKSMETLTALVTSLSATVDGLVKKLETAAPAATSLAVVRDGKTIQLSGEDVFKRLEAADKLVADASKSVEDGKRKEIIGKMQAECRVAINPDTDVAYKVTELEALPLNMLQFAAKNSQVLPTMAKATYTGSTKPTPAIPVDADGKPLKNGTGYAAAMWEADYGDLEKMMQQPAVTA